MSCFRYPQKYPQNLSLRKYWDYRQLSRLSLVLELKDYINSILLLLSSYAPVIGKALHSVVALTSAIAPSRDQIRARFDFFCT